jgi:sugar phosphate permease
MLEVYSIVGFTCIFSLFLLVIFSFFDIRYGRPDNTNGAGSQIASHGEKIDCKSFKYLNSKIIWYNIVNTWFSQHVYYAFSTWITNLLTKRFQFALTDSTFYQALVPISVMIGIPFWSAIAVKKGKKMTLMLGAYFLAILCFITIYLMPAERDPLVSIPLFLIG